MKVRHGCIAACIIKVQDPQCPNFRDALLPLLEYHYDYYYNAAINRDRNAA